MAGNTPRLLLIPKGTTVTVCEFIRRSGKDCSLRDSNKVGVNQAQIWGGKYAANDLSQIAQTAEVTVLLLEPSWATIRDLRINHLPLRPPFIFLKLGTHR